MATYIYRSAQAHINNEVYPVEALEGYQPNIPKAMIEGMEDVGPNRMCLYGTGIKASNYKRQNVGGLVPMSTQRLRNASLGARYFPKPVFTPEASREVRMNLTIAHLIDLHSTQKYFKIMNDRSVLEIFHTVDSYLKEIRPLISDGNQAVIIYAQKTIAFRQDLFKLVRRLLNLHPDWKEAYWGGMGVSSPIMKDILALIGMFDPSARTSTFDPLTRMSIPPYYIDDKNKIRDPIAEQQPAKEMSESEVRDAIGPQGVSTIQYGRPKR